MTNESTHGDPSKYRSHQRRTAPSGARSRAGRRALLVAAVLLVGLVSALLVFNTAQLQKAASLTTERYESDVSAQIAANVEQRLKKITVDLDSVADSLVRLDREDEREEFLDRKAEMLGFTRIFEADAEGNVVGRAGDTSNIASQAGFRAAMAGEPGVTVLDDQSISYTVPIVRDDAVCGVLVGLKDKTSMQKLMQNGSFEGASVSCIVDSQGNVVISPVDLHFFMELDDVFQERRDEAAVADIERMRTDMRQGRDGTLSFTTVDDEDVVMAYNPLDRYGWVLLTLVPADIVSAPMNRSIAQTFAIVGIAVLAFAAILFVILALERSHRRNIEEIAFVDPLTGGMSASRFRIVCQKLVEDAGSSAWSIASLNVRDFRLINESFGNDKGNDVLRHILRVVDGCLGADEAVARGEADHFYLLLKESDRTSIEKRIERIAEDANAFNERREHPYYLVLNCGVYVAEDRELDVVAMIDRANDARRGSPERPGALCRFYDAEAVERLKREKELANLLDGSIEKRDFVVNLQPKVRLSDGKVVGAEALVRWHHPRWGTVNPAEFIPVFEKSGDIVKIDLLIFEQVCELLARWITEGREPVPVSVNLSRRHFENPGFLQPFVRIADEHAVPRHLVEMEMTESIFFDNEAIGNVKRAVEAMHEFGFTCSLDDFGSGYSSLGLLKEFDVDALKLDRCFFQDDSERARDVVEAVVRLAGKLGLTTVAEGIEDDRWLRFLRAVGCDSVQGYVFSKPLPREEFECWADARNAAALRNDDPLQT